MTTEQPRQSGQDTTKGALPLLRKHELDPNRPVGPVIITAEGKHIGFNANGQLVGWTPPVDNIPQEMQQ